MAHIKCYITSRNMSHATSTALCINAIWRHTQMDYIKTSTKRIISTDEAYKAEWNLCDRCNENAFFVSEHQPRLVFAAAALTAIAGVIMHCIPSPIPVVMIHCISSPLAVVMIHCISSPLAPLRWQYNHLHQLLAWSKGLRKGERKARSSLRIHSWITEHTLLALTHSDTQYIIHIAYNLNPINQLTT